MITRTRDEIWEYVSELSGYDSEGNILPSPPIEINRQPVPWWKNHLWRKAEKR